MDKNIFEIKRKIEPKKTSFLVYAEEEKHSALKKIAKDNKLSVNFIMCQLADNFINYYESGKVRIA